MEEHVFIAGDDGLCQTCGRTREQCGYLMPVYQTGQAEKPQYSVVNKTIQFFEQMPDECKVHQICSTKYNTFVLSIMGKIYSWGEITNALGRALEKRDDARIPKLVYDLRNKHIVQIAAGENHVLALDDEGRVWTWGFNKFGQLGLGDLESRSSPEVIESLREIIRIQAGANFSFAVSSHGTVYCWGDNKNYQLGTMIDSNGHKANKFVVPREIENVPWEKTKSLYINQGIGNKVFFYSSALSGQKSEKGVSTAEVRKLTIENDDLRKKNEMLMKKVRQLDEERRAQNLKQGEIAIGPDPVLYEMENLTNKATMDIDMVNGQIVQKEEQIYNTNQEIEMIENDIKTLDDRHETLWDEIEQKDNDIRRLQLSSKKDFSRLAELQNKRDGLKELVNTLEHTKATYYTELTLKKDSLYILIDEKDALITKLEDLQKLETVYKTMVQTRKKELSRDYIEQHQDSLEKDLNGIIALFEATKDTVIEVISQNIVRSNLSHAISLSNDMLKKIQREVYEQRKQKDLPIYKSVNRIWNLLEDNIKLRLLVNDYMEGLLSHTADRLFQFYANHGGFFQTQEYDRRPVYITTVNYIKKVYEKAKIKLKKEDLELYDDPYERKQKQLKTSRKPKYRFC